MCTPFTTQQVTTQADGSFIDSTTCCHPPPPPRLALTRPAPTPQITVLELGDHDAVHHAIQPTTTDARLWYDVPAQYGARYAVTVQTTATDAVPAAAVTFTAPPIPGPYQLRPIVERNGTVALYWKERRLPADMKYVK